MLQLLKIRADDPAARDSAAESDALSRLGADGTDFRLGADSRSRSALRVKLLKPEHARDRLAIFDFA